MRASFLLWESLTSASAMSAMKIEFVLYMYVNLK